MARQLPVTLGGATEFLLGANDPVAAAARRWLVHHLDDVEHATREWVGSLH